MLSQDPGEALRETSFGRSSRVGINASEVKNNPSHLETHSPLDIADVSLQTQPFKDEGRQESKQKSGIKVFQNKLFLPVSHLSCLSSFFFYPLSMFKGQR